ncbi:hypothetical protein C8A01DRAFT_20484 [Parachaetomium inaequale]|uniref:Uncharacterized protein n=1 Tax=Parachaetomium inaequale TaxID=2588326 RepID=A0AAN6P6C0_9PEZI|nr:hypothetical protein C8A01DRAFT_20484 [Parachaetomium inaequale]
MDPDCYRLAAGVYGIFATSDGAAAAGSGARPKKKTKQTAAAARRRRRQQHKKKTGNFSSLRTGLGYLSLLVPAYAIAQSFVGGDLSSQAPWGLPPQDFVAAIAAPSSNATFPITGYNTSVPAGGAGRATGDADAVAGWSLTIGVTAGIPLTHSASALAADRDLCIDATALSVTPPAEIVTEAGGYNRTGWRVCAVVFTGGLKAGASSGVRAADGSCGGVLPDACIRQLEANSVAGKAGRTGGCRDLDVPVDCRGHFNGGGGTGFGEFLFLMEITPIGNTSALADGRSLFFAAWFEPVRKGNKTALAAAERRVWPVLLAWTHFGAVPRRDKRGNEHVTVNL